MIGLEGSIRARQNAPFHVEIELEERWHEPSDFESISVHGRVVRVFRGDGRLTPDDEVKFTLWVCQPGNEPTSPAYAYQDDFRRATHMEVYLSGSPPNCEIAAYEFVLLGAPSEKPRMSVEELLALSEGADQRMDPERRRWPLWKKRKVK